MGLNLSSFLDVRSRRQRHRSGQAQARPLICFSHLRWGFVWQRPQHIMTRLAEAHPVYFVEEPEFEEGGAAPRLESRHQDGVTVLVPVLPAAEHRSGGYCSANNHAVRALLEPYFGGELAGDEVIAWYYTPMALGTLPGSLTATVSIFDAMDELANFRNAPGELREREQALMSSADLVFSGGPSLHEARKHRHPRAYCFPSGVDVEHFRRADGESPADVASLPAPIVGFYGVLDERVDFDLLGQMAELRPDWTFVMVGPVVKIQESELARGSNIHYPGMRSYSELPRYLASFDAAILPFALNEATRFISPTKTLEYLAGGKPVVSTPVKDVVDLYHEVVEIAESPVEFVNAIESLWSENDIERAKRRHRVEVVLEQHHWDTIAAGMLELIQNVGEHRAVVPTAWGDVRSPSSIDRGDPIREPAS